MSIFEAPVGECIMRVRVFSLAALVAVTLSSPALADDPKDPAMRSPAARARDSEIIRQLNLRQLAEVRERDSRYAADWRAARERNERAGEGYSASLRDHESAMDDYARERARYERQMAQWRHVVAACGAGYYQACD